MGSISKFVNSWRHFGTIALLSKAWEKFVIDKRRFRSGLQRTVPEFSSRVSSLDVPEMTLPSLRSLHICFLIHYFFPDKSGGTERFVLNIAKILQKQGNRVTIITLGKRPLSKYSRKTGEIYSTRFEFEGVEVVQIRYQRAPRGLYYDTIAEEERHMAKFAEEFFRENDIDVVHAAYPQPFSPFLKICQTKNIPYVVTLTDFNMICHYATLVNKNGHFCSGSDMGRKCVSCKTYGVKGFKERYNQAAKLLRGADFITVPSEFVAKIFESEFNDISVAVIPHGIGDSFQPVRKRTSPKKFIYAGTLSDLKGVHLLISAFKQLTEDDISLAIYGEGELSYTAQLKAMSQRDKRITFKGNLAASEMNQAYQNADCVIVPSIWFETYNFVLREALACGCLAVASDIGAMTEAIDEGKNGFLFKAGDEKDLLKALRYAVEFDWANYLQKLFPVIDEEALKYEKIYHYVNRGLRNA